MQKKYSSDKETIRLTESDLNSSVSIVGWIEANFKEDLRKEGIKNINPKDLISAIDGILGDENFTSLSDEKDGKKRRFIGLFNEIKEKLDGIKELT